MTARDTLFDEGLLHRFFCEGRTTEEERERIARSLAEVWPCADDAPPEIRHRAGHVVRALEADDVVFAWFATFPGLPRLLATVEAFARFLENLENGEKDSWIVKNLRLLEIPEQLAEEWNPNGPEAGVGYMESDISSPFSHRELPLAGWYTEQYLQLFRRAADGPHGSPQQKDLLREAMDTDLAHLREDAAAAGIVFDPTITLSPESQAASDRYEKFLGARQENQSPPPAGPKPPTV
ncbi:MAG: hypothetical protein QG608_1453 [Actinomycetota bacterium]|nr:hypothetical protein [Actinomycetota bacterium]